MRWLRPAVAARYSPCVVATMLGRTLYLVFLLHAVTAELDSGSSYVSESASGNNFVYKLRSSNNSSGGAESRINSGVELYDGVFLVIPGNQESNGGTAAVQLDVGRNLGEGRGKSKKLFQRILPLFILPFLIQSAIIPFFLSALKFMLFKSVMVGKVAMALIAFNAFRSSNAFKGREDERMAAEHYGYRGAGMEEYGAYVN